MKYVTIVRDDLESKKVEEIIKENVKVEYSENNPDYVVAIGGDGTIIKASHKYPDSTIFGIHTGHLGFYANYSTMNLNDLINDINNNDFESQDIDYISCELEDNNGNVKILGRALNEITILTPLRTLALNVCIDNNFFETFKGTGLCISTPFGSTAYNKSLHGAVIDNRLNAIQLTEIAGINSNAYRTLASPLVLANNRIIKLDNCDNIDKAYITIDYLSYEIADFKSIIINSSNKKIKMAYHKYEDQLERIRRTFLK